MSKKLVIDSSVLIVLSRRGKLEEYLKRRRYEGYEVLIPQAIARELIDEPRRLAEGIRQRSPTLASSILDSVEEIGAAIDHGLIKVVTVDYRKYSRVIGNVRRYLSRLEAEPEHAVKKGDPEILALVIQLYERFNERVTVATRDKGLLRVLRLFRDRVQFEVL
mgnify:CR=1 FL=1